MVDFQSAGPEDRKQHGWRTDPSLEKARFGSWRIAADNLDPEELIRLIRADDPKLRARAENLVTSLATLLTLGNEEEQARARHCFQRIGLLAADEILRGVDSVRVVTSFSALMAQVSDGSKLLSATMDFIAREVGYCNIGIWLARDGEQRLGAYLKYDTPLTEELHASLSAGLVQVLQQQWFLHIAPESCREVLTGEEERFGLRNADIVGLNCRDLEGTAASVILFRSDSPFTDRDERLLKAIEPVFVAAIRRCMSSLAGPDASDSGEWWKTGEDPPF